MMGGSVGEVSAGQGHGGRKTPMVRTLWGLPCHIALCRHEVLVRRMGSR